MQRILLRATCTMLLLGLAGCHAPADRGKTAMELKIYSVPAQQSLQLAGALGNALGKTANVTVPASGRLLVYAPTQAQGSIAATLASLGKDSFDGQPPAQMDVHFWIIDALPGAGSDDPALKALSPTLAALGKTIGPLHFQLAQSVSGITSAGNHGSSIATAPDGGVPNTFDFQIRSVSGATMDLWLDYEGHGQTGLAKFRTWVSTQPGQYVVIAQGPGTCAASTPGMAAPPCPVKPALRLLVVRVDLLPPQA